MKSLFTKFDTTLKITINGAEYTGDSLITSKLNQFAPNIQMVKQL